MKASFPELRMSWDALVLVGSCTTKKLQSGQMHRDATHDPDSLQ